MAWETRKGRGRYYTRSVRTADGRVGRQYVGTGEVAELAAALDAEARARRAAEAEAFRRGRERLGPPDRATTELNALCVLLVEATLVAAGYHRHGGEWRRRRARKRAAATDA